jgi:UDP-N-acetylmuramate--alanine ligase
MRIHLIGIGGIGISGLAKYLFLDGHTVTGSDQTLNKVTKDLIDIGISVNAPHHQSSITEDIDLIIHSAIIKSDNVEIIEAKKLGIKTLSRSKALPEILGNKRVFSVCGAHGKSTTSAILSSILGKSSIIGAYNKTFGSNINYVKGNEIVFEADESDGSFLNSNPYYSIVTNTEPEHMEFYNYDYEKFYEAYREFLEIAKVRVVNGEDQFIEKLDIEAIRLFPSKDIRDIKSRLIDGEPFIEFELLNYGKFSVWGFGEHIALDTSLAILTAIDYGLSIGEIQENLLTYRGIEKRFDILQKSEDFILIDDYGHHPTEIEATLKSAFQYAEMVGIDEVVAVWQPHKYSRTVDNLAHFQSCFRGVSKLIILPVWRAGEDVVEIDFKELFKEYSPIFSERVHVSERDVKLDSGTRITKGLIIGFGAGDITYQLRGKV